MEEVAGWLAWCCRGGEGAVVCVCVLRAVGVAGG